MLNFCIGLIVSVSESKNVVSYDKTTAPRHALIAVNEYPLLIPHTTIDHLVCLLKIRTQINVRPVKHNEPGVTEAVTKRRLSRLVRNLKYMLYSKFILQPKMVFSCYPAPQKDIFVYLIWRLSIKTPDMKGVVAAENRHWSFGLLIAKETRVL